MKVNLQNSKQQIQKNKIRRGATKVLHIFQKGIRNTERGITLVALIITVIVLLILAMVSIRLVMNGGIIGKAESSTSAYTEAEIKEKIGTAYQEYKMSQYNNPITFEQALSNSGLTGATVSEDGLTVSYNKYSFSVSSNGEIMPLTQVDIINEKIGEVVQGYNAQNLEWQIFYADANETFLITKTAPKSFKIPTKRKKQTEEEQEYTYIGSQDVRNSLYGFKWNKKWLDKCVEQEQTTVKSQATAYMCDPNNWMEYKTSPANYAVGGPTVELFLKSWNKSKNQNLSIGDEDVTAVGYVGNKPGSLASSGSLNGIYNVVKNYFIASPSTHQDPSIVRGVNYNGALTQFYNSDANIYIRPIVSISTSKISVDGDNVKVNS